MAKKAELLQQAKELKLDVSTKNTIAEIEAALKAADSPKSEVAVTKTVEKPEAKAGKRSKKALEEVEKKVEKETRKATGDTSAKSDDAPRLKKGAAPKTRPLVERRGKKYQEAAKKVEAGKLYALADAMKLASETSTTKFDSSVEMHVVLGVDPRQADQNVRATVSLPHGTGKTVRVAAYVPAEEVEAAKKAGADVAGEEEIQKLLDKQRLDFDILVSTPQLMPKLGKYARLLGPRGLMPNPKSGTVATNAAKAVREAKGGRVEYRVDKQSIVHVGIGKVSFGGDKLTDNAKAFFASLQSVKPSSLKASYILTATTTTTMGPGIKIELSSF